MTDVVCVSHCGRGMQRGGCWRETRLITEWCDKKMKFVTRRRQFLWHRRKPKYDTRVLAWLIIKRGGPIRAPRSAMSVARCPTRRGGGGGRNFSARNKARAEICERTRQTNLQTLYCQDERQSYCCIFFFAFHIHELRKCEFKMSQAPQHFQPFCWLNLERTGPVFLLVKVLVPFIMRG